MMAIIARTTSISISTSTNEEINAHAEEAYPHECCGVLVGTGAGTGEKIVTRAIRTENLNKDRARDRFEIAPAELNRIDKEARNEGLDIVGFFHSHPDHPAAPSGFDRQRGQIGYSYLITTVNDGKVHKGTSWVLHNEDDEDFIEEEIKITTK